MIGPYFPLVAPLLQYLCLAAVGLPSLTSPLAIINHVTLGGGKIKWFDDQ